MAAGATATLQVVEGGSALLTCATGTTITVSSALFNQPEAGCAGQDSDLPKAAAACDGKAACELPATVAFFGDPCPAVTPKYLRVTYT